MLHAKKSKSPIRSPVKGSCEEGPAGCPCDPVGRCVHGVCNLGGDCVCHRGWTGVRCSFMGLSRKMFQLEIIAMVSRKMNLDCRLVENRARQDGKPAQPQLPAAKRPPVFLIPPLEGSWLESTLDGRMAQPDPMCQRVRSHWKQFWLPDIMLFKGDDAACWAAQATLEYDSQVMLTTLPRRQKALVNCSLPWLSLSSVD